MGVRHVLLALAVMLAACDAPTVPVENPGYDPRLALNDSSNVFYHWPLGHTIKVYAHSNGAPTGFDLPAAIERANAIWGDPLRYREFDVQLVSDPAGADVVFHFDTDSVVRLPCGTTPGGAAGVTSFCLDATETTLLSLLLVGGDSSTVKFDVQISASPTRIPNAAVFQRIVAHEFGHVIGIGTHSGTASDLMFGGPTVDLPSVADAQTLRYLLHQPAQLRP